MSIRSSHRTLLVPVLGLGLVASGCGIERFLNEGFDDTNPTPGITIEGEVIGQFADLDEGDEVPVTVYNSAGATLDFIDRDPSWTSVDEMTNNFDVFVPRGCYRMAVIEATQGQLSLRKLMPQLSPEPPEGQSCGSASGTVPVRLDVDSTTTMLVVEARLAADGRGLGSLDAQRLEGGLATLEASYEVDGPSRTLRDYVGRILAQASPTGGDAVPFVTPEITPDFQTVTSALSTRFLQVHRNLDFDGDGMADTSSTAVATKFDALLAEVAQDATIYGCPDPDRVRVLFEVDFNDGGRDGNCNSVNRFLWANDADGKAMFFVGGVHEESPVADAELTAAMGAWSPNNIPMYDDGTNGDQVAGDNIWTIYFDMKIGTRVGYKYTWGTPGALWTGSEEWPGNQRVLEAIDITEPEPDGFVRRRDVFQDEASNKDRVNLRLGGTGNVSWDTDADDDGFLDARELPLDLDNDCTLDEWITPVGLGPATVDCADL